MYSVFFFIELKVFVNLTFLYLSEIKKQGLIFSIGKWLRSSWTWPYSLVYYTNKALVYYTKLDRRSACIK